jgi:hypothetical protein
MLKTLKKLFNQPRSVYGPGVRKYQLFVFWLSMAVAIGLPTLMLIAIVIVQIVNRR